MKDIKHFINESSKGWEYFKSVTDPSTAGINLPGLENKNTKWLLINTQNEMIAPYTESDLKQASEDLEDDGYLEKSVKALKIGESFDSDGGINIYIRIKK